MNKITSLLMAFICLASINAQVIRFERTDVDSKDANYVTATYSFGIDIRIDSIANCSNVSFELAYNRVNYVKFSEYSKSEDWNIKNDWSKVVTIIDANTVDNPSDRGIVAIEAGTGMPADIDSPDNPKIIHLEFVITPAAIHSEVLTFSISKIKATYFKDTIVQLVIPTTYKVNYYVHSYVNVYPGDVNCDGVVDVFDNSEISKYLTEPGIKARSFKRKNASNLWIPQPCIAWDTLAATFADCDGNGVVTTSDLAVVKLNYAKTHSAPCSTQAAPSAKAIAMLQSDIDITPNTKIIPINIDMTETDFTGIAGVIDYAAQPDVKVKGIKIGEFFSQKGFLHYYINDKTNITSFYVYDDMPTKHSNVVAYLYLDTPEPTAVNIADFIGFDDNANIKQLRQSTTSITLPTDVPKIYYNNHTLYLPASDALQSIQVVNILGAVVKTIPASVNECTLNLPNGLYLIVGIGEYTTIMVMDN
ncbi:MAG: dockerin type I domain-containing protein [Ignavibacteria bacterium]|jgi:hypothetical protein|nr:dockerin type I domain-containing protein [Ignavibacteria bacterium]